MKIIQTNLNYRFPLTKLELNKVKYLVLHHPSWVSASVEDIHRDVLNDTTKSDWAGIGYNEYIRKDGTVYICRGDNIGSQCEGMNSKSYGISCEGNYDQERAMPEAQFDSLIERIKYHKLRMPNKLEVAPHSRYNSTSCPGKYFPMGRVLTALTMPLLKVGEIGEAVSFLQSQLNKKGFDCGTVDGMFGKKTLTAVIRFQSANGLAVDGIVGPKTWAKLG